MNYPDYQVEKLATFRELFQRFQSFDQKIAFVETGREISYGELCHDIQKVMAVCPSAGGRFVLIKTKSKYRFAVAYFATVLSGNIACLQPCNLELLPCFASFDFALTLDDEAVASAVFKEQTANPVFKENPSFCTVLCSSGTTALPKAIALGETNIVSDLISGMQKYEFASGGVYVSILPYTHAFGLVCDLLGPLYSASVIYPAYDPLSFVGALPAVRPTAMNATPGIVELLLARLQAVGSKEQVVGDRLKKILSGGAGTPAALSKAMEEYGIGVYGCYGLSECSPCVSVNRDLDNHHGSAGILLNCNTIRVENTGELCITGSNVMFGYLDEKGALQAPPLTEYATGDIGYVDDEGYLYIVGRADDLLILSDGNKLMPQNAESLLTEISGIQDAVVYLKDGKLAATIVLKKGADEETVLKAVRKEVFCGYKLMDVTVESALKKNALGKLERKSYGR